MKLQLSHNEITEIVGGTAIQFSPGIVDIVIYDTRKIGTDRSSVFFALKGLQKDGHIYCQDAYDKGCRCFVISEDVSLPKDCHVIKVENTLKAFQQLAKVHRSKFTMPVLAVTGSFGKTTVKEWLYFLLKDEYTICRSPKSYNSQIGVAHALLNIEEHHDLVIIEAAISHPEEMDQLEEMIAPTLGVFTKIGNKYAENFASKEAHLTEYLKLFKHANFTVALREYAAAFRRKKINTLLTEPEEWESFEIANKQFTENRALCLKMAEFFGITEEVMEEKMKHLPVLSGRQEVFEGINNNLIINDAYNIDIDALEQALEYQFASKEKEKKYVVLDLNYVKEQQKEAVLKLVDRYQPDGVFVIENDKIPDDLKTISNASILFKGSFRSNLSELVKQFKNRKHETWVSFDLKAIQHNLKYLQSLMNPGTHTLVMVKASSYGTGDVKLPHFLQENGVDYLGVAYTDEGATLREQGINLPILVMNSEIEAFKDMIRLCLEPSIYSFEQLHVFIQLCMEADLTDYPIHLKFETGMHRLGFAKSDIPAIVNEFKTTKAVAVKSVFSHLADADNEDQTFTLQQIDLFKAIISDFKDNYDDSFWAHILNSEGILRHGKIASFDMVRLGIGIFGYASKHDDLLPCIEWKTTISQLKKLNPGDTIGYGRAYTAKEPMTIATLRVGYADGFRRALSNGVGKVYINNQACPVVGNVCMDMIMVDVTHVDCKQGDSVEIIGKQQTMQDFAAILNTIPYEVMTSINKRVARVYVRS